MGSPKFFDVSLPACHGLRTPADLHTLTMNGCFVLASGTLKPSPSATNSSRSCTGVDPVSWTLHLLGRRSPRCRNEEVRIRRSSGDRWSSWSGRAATRKSCRGSLSRRRRRSATGWRRRTEMKAGTGAVRCPAEQADPGTASALAWQLWGSPYLGRPAGGRRAGQPQAGGAPHALGGIGRDQSTQRVPDDRAGSRCTASPDRVQRCFTAERPDRLRKTRYRWVANPYPAGPGLSPSKTRQASLGAITQS